MSTETSSRLTGITATISFIVLIVSVLWFIAEPGYEPTIVLLLCIATLVPSAISASKRSGSFINRLIYPLILKREKSALEAVTEFDALVQGKADKHRLEVKRVWGRSEPTLMSQVIHSTSNIEPYTIFLVDEGHHFEFELIDMDGDGNSEAVLRYACGAHSRKALILKATYGHYIKKMSPSIIFSNWPEITIEDRDSDGTMEIYAKQRNRKNYAGGEPEETVHKLSEGMYIEQGAHNN